MLEKATEDNNSKKLRSMYNLALTRESKEGTKEVSEVYCIISVTCDATTASPQVGPLIVMPASAISIEEASRPGGRGRGAKKTNNFNRKSGNEARHTFLREQAAEPEAGQGKNALLCIANEVL